MYKVLAYQVVNQGTEEEPEYNRIGGFITLKSSAKLNWKPQFNQPIPDSLIVKEEGVEENEGPYLFVAKMDDSLEQITNVLQTIEDNFETCEHPVNRLGDYCIKIVDAVLGPVKPQSGKS